MGQERLKLNEFKALYTTLKTGVVWIDHLLLGLLFYLEQKLIDNRVKVEVDKAIGGVEIPHLPDMVTPVYRESPSKTSIARSEQATRLPELRITAPWYVSPDKGPKGR